MPLMFNPTTNLMVYILHEKSIETHYIKSLIFVYICYILSVRKYIYIIKEVILCQNFILKSANTSISIFAN